jgi:hypothetical protein
MKQRQDITTLEWIKGIPCICAAICARLIRFLFGRVTYLEEMLMEYYEETEKEILGE